MVEPIDIRTGKPFVSRRCHEHHPPSDGASLGGAMGRTRGLLGGCFTGCMMAQQSKPWSNPYITEGLMLFGDAEWNAGGGVHTSDRSMVNLGYGDGVISLSADCVVGTNSVTINGGNGISAAGTGFDFANNSGGTIEIVGRFANYRVGSYVFQLNSKGWYSADNYNIKWGYDGGWDLSSYSPPIGAKFKLWARGANKYGSTENSTYINRVINKTKNFGYFSSDSSTFFVGKLMKGDIYSFRVYDRVLSLDELEQNTLVDSQRFGLEGGMHQVEYISSTGTQFINTLHEFASNDYRIVADVVVPVDATLEKAVFGNAFTNGYMLWFASLINRSMWVGGGQYASGGAVFPWGLGVRSTYDVNPGYFTVSNGSETVRFATINPNSLNSFSLFTDNATSSRCATCSFYGCKIYDGGVLVRDFAPVRFTNENGVTEGAMYDSISGELFRNAGTGQFGIGPDKD